MNKQKYTLIKITAALLIGAGMLRISALIFKGKGPELVVAIPAYLVSITVLILLAVLFRETDRLTGLRHGWKAFFTKGWYILIVSGIFVLLLGIGLPREKNLVFSPVNLICFAVVCLLTACYEEIWFRGIILGILDGQGRIKGRSFWKTACIGSALFGATHLLNLLHRPDYILGTITQVLYAFSLGMILSMVIYCGGNIGAAVLLHAVFNFCGSLSEVFVQRTGAQTGDMTAASAVYILVLLMPGIFAARRMYRKKEKQKCVG